MAAKCSQCLLKDMQIAILEGQVKRLQEYIESIENSYRNTLNKL